MTFLASRDPRRLDDPSAESIRPVGLFLGQGAMGVEVAVYESPRRPAAPDLRELHKHRLGKRATPVVIAVLWGDARAALAGPSGGELGIHLDASRDQAERLCGAALDAADRHAATRFISSAFDQLTAAIPGLRNAGLFALQELEAGVPSRNDWRPATEAARALLNHRGRALIEGLGYTIHTHHGQAAILADRDSKLALAVFLDRPDEIDPANPRFDGVSPVSYALAQADRENLDYVVVSAGPALRIYPVKPGVGVGRRGRTETYVEVNLDLLAPEQAGYLWLLASSAALTAEGTFAEVLGKSAIYAADLGGRLRERVYEDVVPNLAKAVVEARRLRKPTADNLRETYEIALLALFRLLFVAYAEDKELLPLQTSPAYRKHSLKEIARQLAEVDRTGKGFDAQDFYWTEVSQLWKAVDQGNRAWGVPAYNGGLFSSDPGRSKAGAVLEGLSLPDSAFGPALSALLLDDTSEGGKGPIDFRSLGVREFGTIYEGLLESELSVAETDLAVDPRSGAYLPVRGKAEPVVREGEVYLHNASGARKASGAYYTKDFAVEHLLDHALEPALDDHLARLGALDERAAAERFFDFRVADIAMGSGHFLVAVVDRIERRLSNYVAGKRLPGVTDELERLRTSAREALGPEWTGDPIEDTQLLRRQIARRCVFGVDLNPLAVELSRLSLWIHTFVPGLPLSFLDGNLVVGNSLVGIATFEEAGELIGASSGDLFSFTAVERLGRAREPLARLARLADATAAEVREAQALYDQAREQIEGEASLLTVLAASRIDQDIANAVVQRQVATRLAAQGDVFSDALVRKAERALDGLHPFHFPIAFPQVFLGERAGFDVIVGNPPWEEATVEEDAFWARHFPGLRALPQRQQEERKTALRRERPDLVTELEAAMARAERLRAVLTSGPFPGMGTGDPDVYKAFCWRFWELVAREGGRIGVVLPRSALSAKGSAEFRVRVFGYARDVNVTTLLNNRQWIFEEVHPQYTIALVVITRGKSDSARLALRGPFASLLRFREQVTRPAAVFYGNDVAGWNDTASLPLLPAEDSPSVFAKIRRAPRLDLDDGRSWRARPAAELHATNDKPLMDLESEKCPDGFWPVFKGESFDLWTPDTGTYYAWADPGKVSAALQDKRVRAGRGRGGVFSAFPRAWLEDPSTHPALHPRVVFRDITNRTNQRTVIASLVPGKVYLTNKAPYFLWLRGDEQDQAFLLGVLCSRALDWYARRFIEISLNFYILNPFPIPRPALGHPLRLRVVDTAGRLAAQDRRLWGWSKKVGVKGRRLAEDEQADLIAELDAAVAHLYGLAESDLVHIFETFHEGWDFQDRLDATLRHFVNLKGLAG